MDTRHIIMRSTLCLLFLLGSSLLASPVAAQVFDLGPSDSTLFDSIINAPADLNIGVEASVGGDGLTTQLNVSDDGSVGNSFEANSGSEINISGGLVGSLFSANSGSEVNVSGGFVDGQFVAESGSVVNISGGSVSSFFDANSGSEINISGGLVGNFFDANSGSEVNISGGTVAGFFEANSGSVVNISGGIVNDFFDANFGSVINISGGNVGGNFDAFSGSEVNISGGSFGDSFGSFFNAITGSEVNLFGNNFVLDGVPLDGGLTVGEALTIDSRGVTLTGRFADGSSFCFDLNSASDAPEDFFSSDATLTATLVSPVPTVVFGDVNLDGVVDFFDIPAFIAVVQSGEFQAEADCDENGVVDFSDIGPFIQILLAS